MFAILGISLSKQELLLMVSIKEKQHISEDLETCHFSYPATITLGTKGIVRAKNASFLLMYLMHFAAWEFAALLSELYS